MTKESKYFSLDDRLDYFSVPKSKKDVDLKTLVENQLTLLQELSDDAKSGRYTFDELSIFFTGAAKTIKFLYEKLCQSEASN